MTTDKARFTTVTLSHDATVELSIDSGELDAFHQALTHGHLLDPSWRYIYNWVRPSDTFFDVGANIGAVTLTAAKKRARVYAFELLPMNAAHIRRSLERNGLQAVVTEGAVSDRPGTVRVSGTSAWGHVHPVGEQEIRAFTLDAFIAEHRIDRVDVMKIDVEGHEMAAFAGARGMLERWRPDVIFESNVLTSGSNGYAYTEILAFLESYGYRFYRFGPAQLYRNREVVQETIYADFFATVKPEPELIERGGWPVEDFSDDVIAQNILGEEGSAAIHRHYVLQIADRLPITVRETPLVAAALARWRAESASEHASVLATGSGHRPTS